MHANINRSKRREAKYIKVHLKYFVWPIFCYITNCISMGTLSNSKVALHGIKKITPPPPWRCGPTQAMASSFLRFLDHTQRRVTVGRTPLDAWAVRRRTLPHNTQHSQQTDIHDPGGIRNHNLSRRAAADLRLRPRGHWVWNIKELSINISPLEPLVNYLSSTKKTQWNWYVNDSSLKCV